MDLLCFPQTVCWHVDPSGNFFSHDLWTQYLFHGGSHLRCALSSTNDHDFSTVANIDRGIAEGESVSLALKSVCDESICPHRIDAGLPDMEGVR